MKDNMLSILANLDSTTSSETIVENVECTNSVLSVLNELSSLETVAPNVASNVTRDAVIEEENDMVVLCTACNSMVLRSELEEGMCPVCGSDAQFIEVGVVAPEGTTNCEGETVVSKEPVFTNESVEGTEVEEELEDDATSFEDDEVETITESANTEKLAAKVKTKEDALRTISVFASEQPNEVTMSLVIDLTHKFKLSKKEVMDALKDKLAESTITESAELDEATKKVIRNGQVVKVKIKTRKAKMSADQKAALKKARKKANTAGAKKARKKSMKVRARKINETTSLTEDESLESRKKQLMNSIQLDEKGMGSTAKVIDAIGRAAKQLKATLTKEIEADASFARFIDKKMNEVYKELLARMPKVVSESLNLPDELIMTESIGLAVVSDMGSELETIAKELGFELAEGSYVKVVEGITLVLDESEGDVEGVVIYGVDATGETLSEEALAGVLAVAGIEFEVEDDQLEEACKKKAKNESDDLEDEEEDSEDEEEDSEDEEEDLEETKEKKRRCNSKNESVVVNESFKYSEVINHPKLVKLGANQIKKLDLNGEDGTCGACEYQLSVENADKVLKSLKIDMDNPEVMVAYVCYDCGAIYLTQDAGNDFYVYKVK